MSPPSEAHAAVTVHDPGAMDPGLVDRLVRSFSGHLEASVGGMAFAVYRDGSPLLRLYGGVTERGGTRPWDESTIAVLFSGTKGLTATIAALLVDRGQLDPDAPVAEYWPEFAASGKADVRVHHVLSHTVGLPYVDPDPVDDAERADSALMAARLAQQAPLWEPGSKIAYHAMTYGYLMSEIILRVAGQSVGTLLRTELAEPLDLDVHLGLPESEEVRVAPIFRADDYRISTYLKDDPQRRAIVDRMYGASLTGDTPTFNTRAWHAAELAAGGALGSADAMARLYSLLISAGAPIVPAGVMRQFTRTWGQGTDAINDRPIRFGLGFELDDPIGTYGPVRPAFGHTGAGGGLHGAWPERNLAFSFLPNEMRSEDTDRRVKDLLALLAEAES